MVDDECFNAIDGKCLAINSFEFLEKQRCCADVLYRKFKLYHEDLKDRIRKLQKAFNLWWKVNRELVHRNRNAHPCHF